MTTMFCRSSCTVWCLWRSRRRRYTSPVPAPFPAPASRVSEGYCTCDSPQLLQEVNKDEADKLTDKYSSLSNEFDQRKQDYLKEHEDKGMGMGDWQYEIEMEQNVRYIADMQSQLSRDIA